MCKADETPRPDFVHTSFTPRSYLVHTSRLAVSREGGGSGHLTAISRLAAARLFQRPRGKLYGVFISYYRLEAAADARYLKERLSRSLNRRVFLDTSDAYHLDKILTVSQAAPRSRASKPPMPRSASASSSDHGSVTPSS